MKQEELENKLYSLLVLAEEFGHVEYNQDQQEELDAITEEYITVREEFINLLKEMNK